MAELLVLKGFDEFESLLKALPGRVRTKILSPALRAGTKIIQKDAQSRVPVNTGNLRKSIRVRAMKGAGKKGRIGFVATIGKYGNFKGETFYGGFIEYGFKRGKRMSKGALATLGGVDKRKEVAARPFMRPAFDSKKEEATTLVIRALQDRLEQVAKAAVTGGVHFVEAL